MYGRPRGRHRREREAPRVLVMQQLGLILPIFGFVLLLLPGRDLARDILADRLVAGRAPAFGTMYVPAVFLPVRLKQAHPRVLLRCARRHLWPLYPESAGSVCDRNMFPLCSI